MTKQEILDSITGSHYDIKSNKVSLTYGGLATALFPDVEWFFDKQEGNYSGDWYMVGKDKHGKYYFFTMSYGSCSGCDWMADALSDELEDCKKTLGEIIDSILQTPVIENKEKAIEYAKKFDWQSAYDREANNPFVAEVLEAIEKS